MLHSRKFIYCLIVLFMLFAMIVSGGCGGGSSGGWNMPGGDTGGDNGGNTGGGNGGNNSPTTPAVINGTWRIDSGYIIASDDEGKHLYTVIYKPGRVNELGIEITKNNSSLGESYKISTR